MKGQVPAYFGLCPGDINTKILERMKKVLSEKNVYPYLMKNAVVRIEEARQAAKNSGVFTDPLICLGGDMWCLLPWLGTYAFMALERFLKIKCAAELGIKGMDSSRPYFIQFTMKAKKEEFFRKIFDIASIPFDPIELLYPNEVPIFDKYDEYLPAQLVRKGFAYGVLDMSGMKKRINEWKDLF